MVHCMISGQPVPSYPHSEFAEAFRHYSTHARGDAPREFMADWFVSRYPEPRERDYKIQIFAAIIEYLSDYRDELIAGGVVSAGPGQSGDVVPGSLTAILISHYRVELTTPRPEQVIAACRKRIDEHLKRT
jgi:hypothetical protein